MKEYDVWFNRALEDLDTAKYNLKGDKFNAGLFFLHQSCEKALKALVIKTKKKLIKTHDLVILARELKAPEKIERICKSPTFLYQYTRYPDVSSVQQTDEDINGFLNYTEEVILWARQNI